MQVNVSARHGNLQPGDQELIVEKTEKLRRLFDRITAIEVTVDLQQQENPSVDSGLAEHADDCVATSDSTTVISALDLVIPKVEQQLRRLKEKDRPSCDRPQTP